MRRNSAGGLNRGSRKHFLKKSSGLSRSDASPIKSGREIKKNAPSEDNKLWRVFSLYRRLLFADAAGLTECCTCGVLVHFKSMDAGHYIPRGVERLRYVESNVWPQCRHCNRDLDGNIDAYRVFLDRRIGENARVVLDDYSKFPLPGPMDIRGMLEHYTKMTKRLKEDRQKPNFHGYIRTGGSK